MYYTCDYMFGVCTCSLRFFFRVCRECLLTLGLIMTSRDCKQEWGSQYWLDLKSVIFAVPPTPITRHESLCKTILKGTVEVSERRQRKIWSDNVKGAHTM